MNLETLKNRLRHRRFYQQIAQKYNDLKRYLYYLSEAKRLSSFTPSLSLSTDELFEFHKTTDVFKSNQKRNEILPLLELLKQLNPKTIIEIGTHRGGTLFLFSQIADPSAVVISVDYQYPSEEYRKTLPKLARKNQRIYCVQGDSHDSATLDRVKEILGSRSVDFLFIDGDHTYEGVKQDFYGYSDLVKEKGIIAFHDINPDNFIRYGRKTNSYVGGVPNFWKEVTESCENYQEFIEDINQDGYGIGVIQVFN